MACQVHINDHTFQQFSFHGMDSADDLSSLVLLFLSLLVFPWLPIYIISSTIIYLSRAVKYIMNPSMSTCHKTIQDFATQLHMMLTHLSLYSSEDFFEFVVTDHCISLLLKISYRSTNQTLHVYNNLSLICPYMNTCLESSIQSWIFAWEVCH